MKQLLINKEKAQISLNVKKTTLSAALSLALAVPLSFSVIAEQQSTSDSNPTPPATTNEAEAEVIVITGKRLTSDSALPNRPSSSIYGTDASVLDTPRSISQINAEQLATDVILSSDDLIKYAPGITRGGGQNAGIAPQFRGQGSEVFRDGQRGYSVRHPANFNSFEGADIVAGPSSVIYGSVTGSGGYANYLTKKPDFENYRTSVSALIGTWIPDEESRDSTRFTVDTTGPISDSLAYRVSVTRQRQEDYYDNVENNFNAFYGALAWKPSDRLRADLNASYDDYFDWNITHGWNRPSQELVDNNQYYAGRATPIIQNGTTYWSPVFESGAANSAILGWEQRARNDQGQYLPVAGTYQTISPNTQNNPGTVRGWVYDASLPGNELVSLSRQKSQRAEDQNTSKRTVAQLRVAYDYSPTITLVNSTLYQRAEDTTNATASFQSQSEDTIFDNRFEFRTQLEGDVFGLQIKDDSNSGLIFRQEKNKAISANNSFFHINAYDLSQDPSTKNPGDLLGLNNRNPAGGNAAWIGEPGVPQFSEYFGWLNLPAMYPAGNGLYAESVASYTAKSKWSTTTIFTQHNLRFSDAVGLNIGASHSWVDAEIENPFPLPGASLRQDSDDFRLYSFQISPYFKPTPDSTLYFTADRSTAINTGGFASGLAWGSGENANKLNSLAFDSLSELYEAGLKVDVIPDQLFFSLAGFNQARDQAPDQFNNIARLKIKGVESTVRYQPNQQIRTGLNYTYLSAYNEWTSQAGFAPRGFVPDNGTVFSDFNALNQLPSGRFDAVQIPKHTLTGYIDYRHSSGLGAELSAWWLSEWYLNLSRTVLIPNTYNFDLAVFYRQPTWSATVRVLNLTDELTFVSGLAGSTNTFLQPARGRSIVAQFEYQF